MGKYKKSISCLVVFALVLITAMQTNLIFAAKKSTSVPGTIWFAPMPEKNTQSFISKAVTLNGSEVFTSWGEIEKEEGVYDWSEIDTIKEMYKALGKKISIRIASANFSINDTPSYVYNKYNVRRIAKGEWLDFENGAKNYDLVSGEIVTDKTGNQVLKVSGGSGEKIFLSTMDKQNLYSNSGYAVQFDTEGITDASLFVRISYMKAGAPVKEDTLFPIKSNVKSMKSIEFPVVSGSSDYKISWGIKGTGVINIDNINIIERKSGYHVGRLTFPNYFDPEFKVQYEKFVKAFAAKYGNDPTVDAISVGGYGRWEEMTLCDDTDLNALENQWTTFGFTNEKYIDHVKWCIDQYVKYFPNKNVIMCAVGFQGGDRWRDQNLIDWKTENYAVKKGVGLKYNGWQSMQTEWGSPSTAIFYMMNRYKNTDIPMYFEEGGQVNNTLSEVMGHPISVLNQSVLNGVDYQWIYSTDFLDPYFSKYLQYSNQGAGSTLVTKLYNEIGEFPYTSPKMKVTYKHNDLFMGLFQTKANNRIAPKGKYEIKDGVRYISTTEAQGSISFSLDDRQKYNGMYGSYVVIDYLDKGTDKFTVTVQNTKGATELGTVTKTGSNSWKSVAFYDSSWTNHYRNGDKDNLGELEIYDSGDGTESIKAIELNYVPARDFEEKLTGSAEPVADSTKGTELTRKATTLEITNTGITSGISIPVSPIDQYGYVTLKAKVYAIQNGQETIATTKDYYMPENGDWFYLPLADASRAEKFRIEVTCEKGTARWNTDAQGKPGYRTYEFVSGNEEGAIIGSTDKTVTIEALSSFAQIKIDGAKFDGQTVRIEREMPNGQFAEVVKSASILKGIVTFEPQTAGRYRLNFSNTPATKLKVTYLKRITPPNPTTRYLVGNPIEQFAALDKKELWKFDGGFKSADKDKNGAFTALLSKDNASIQTGVEIKIESDNTHVFHMIIKNETSSNMAKVFWEVDKGGYKEENSMMIPIVANDNQYREYSMPIGSEKTYRGNITGLKLIPAFGHTDVGRVSIFSADLRNGTKKLSTFNEALDIAKIKSDGSVFVENKVLNNLPVPLWAILLLAGAVLAAAFIVLMAVKRPNRITEV